MAVLPVVVLQCVDVVVLAELVDVVLRLLEEEGLVGGMPVGAFGGSGLEVGDVSHAREARPAGGDVQRGFGVRIVGAGSGHQVSLVVLARRRVGPGSLTVFDGGVARVDLGAEVADGEVDGTVSAGFGGDGGLGAGGVGGFVRVGASHVGCSRGCGRRESWERESRRCDGGAKHKRGGDGQ